MKVKHVADYALVEDTSGKNVVLITEVEGELKWAWADDPEGIREVRRRFAEVVEEVEANRPPEITPEEELESFWSRMSPGARVNHWDLVSGFALHPDICKRFLRKKAEEGLAKPAGLSGNYIVLEETDE